MKRTVQTMIIFVVTALLASPSLADWSFSLSIGSGSIRTGLTVGISTSASDWYDLGLDSPNPFEGETLNAYFPHPEWGVIFAGGPVDKFHRDIRGSIPQSYYFEIVSAQPTVTISWDPNLIPEKTIFSLYDYSTGLTMDLKQQSAYTYYPSSGNPQGFEINVSQADSIPPNPPYVMNIQEGNSYFAIAWQPNSESDLAGYKIHFGTTSGSYARTIDLRNVNNYKLANLNPETTYYIVLTAYDENGNESAYSMEFSGMPRLADTVPPSGSVLINSGDEYANNANVSLTLSATDDRGAVPAMCISNIGSCSSWETFQTAKSWSLSSGDGLKRVYAWFRDAEGNVSSDSSDTITLDTAAPLASASPAGGTFSSAQSVMLSSGETTNIYFTLDGSTPTEGSSLYKVFIKIRATTTLRFVAVDRAGNTSGVITETYVIDDPHDRGIGKGRKK